MVRLVAAAVVLSLVGCGELVDRSTAVRAVQDEGYTDVVVVSHNGVAPSISGCGRDDSAAFDVRATNVRHVRVSLTVCCGLVFKACTVRH